jgi:hypothetical protein
MRYKNGIAVILPWQDAEGKRCHSRFVFRGDVDKRRVRRAIRNTLAKMGMRAPKNFIDLVIRGRSYELGT